jgi:hypothetical protein
MRRINWGVTLSAVALVGTALTLGAAVTRATLRTPVVAAPAPEVLPEDGATSEATTIVERVGAEPLTGEVLNLAVERAPFDPDRRAPDQRYLMPGERVVRAPMREERPEPPPAPDFRVLGTIAGPNGGVAVIAVEDEPPRVVAMGAEISGYRVASIDGGRVVMSGQGRNLALEVPDALPTGVAAVEERNQRGGNNNQRGNANNNNNNRTQNQQREVERAQAQVRERMEQLMQQIRETGGAARFEMNGDRAFIVGPNGVRREVQIPDNVGRVQVSPQGNVTFQRGRGAGGGGE